MQKRRINNRIVLIVGILISIAAVPQLLNGVQILFYGNFFYGFGKIVGAIVIPGFFYKLEFRLKRATVK